MDGEGWEDIPVRRSSEDEEDFGVFGTSRGEEVGRHHC